MHTSYDLIVIKTKMTLIEYYGCVDIDDNDLVVDDNDGEENLPEEGLEPVKRFLQYLHHPQALLGLLLS